ncbi:MAG: cyclic pyranopterin monophosphate synthase MoaC [Terriglobia bacterium]
MVDVSGKDSTARVATASGRVRMAPETLDLVKNQGLKKGDVLAVAKIAGVMGAKRTSELIPLCHPLMLTSVDIDFEFDDSDASIVIRATAKTHERTGVEMEALTAVSVAGLAIYDMCKAVDKSMVIGEVELLEKSGGKSGTYRKQL